MLDALESLKDKTSREGVRCSCEHCSKEFFVPKNVVLRALKGANKGRYCSQECQHAFRTKGRAVFSCEGCGIECARQKGDKSNRKFCSRDCANRHYGLLRTEPLKNCHCGNTVPRYGAGACSRRCAHDQKYLEYIAKWKDGEEKGYIAVYFRITNAVRRFIKEKYNNACAKCGWKEINPATGTVPVQIDHIDGDVGNCKEENLILLCPNCHSLTPTFGRLNKESKRNFRRRYGQ